MPRNSVPLLGWAVSGTAWGDETGGIWAVTTRYSCVLSGMWMGCWGNLRTEYIAIRMGNCRRTGQHPENGLTPYSR